MEMEMKCDPEHMTASNVTLLEARFACVTLPSPLHRSWYQTALCRSTTSKRVVKKNRKVV